MKLKENIKANIITGIIFTSVFGFIGYCHVMNVVDGLKNRISKWRSEG